jgi:predicted O-linked N-acetylglucosamine transferase (SPINDLY family)
MNSPLAELSTQLAAWKQKGQLQPMLAQLREAYIRAPNESIGTQLKNIATMLNKIGVDELAADHMENALDYFHLALNARPDFAPALCNAATCLRGLGRHKEATDFYHQAIQHAPHLAAAHDGLLMNMHYDSPIGLHDIAAAHQKWGKEFCKSLEPFTRAPVNTEKENLHIGFVSADFGQHPVGYFLVRFLESMDTQKFTLFGYSEGHREGVLADRLHKVMAQHTNASGFSDHQLAQKIRDDQIDILIDLGGHTAHNRLGVFAIKPAPVQIGWLGYPWENGLPTMDYFIGDQNILPQELQPYLLSRILHLPDCFVCFDPPDSPPLTSLPALTAGHVTFGVLSTPAKCGDDVLTLWAKILQQVPSAQLLFKYAGFDQPECQKRITAFFAQHGVLPERLMYQGASPLPEMFAMMQGIDIALDPFPFSGGLMTAFCLWMGLPLITLPQQTFASRQGLSFLNTIGMPEPIASSAEDYLKKAADLAQDLPRLANIRRMLRTTMAESPLCDGTRASANLQNLLHQAWREKAAQASS